MTNPIDWSLYPNFTEAELRCRHTGACAMDPSFLATLQAIRTTFRRPMVITSGYRHPSHPAERSKAEPGEHTIGRAVDVAVSGADAIDLIVAAYIHGIRRIGVQQKGESRFIHLGGGGPGLASPAIWSY